MFPMYCFALFDFAGWLGGQQIENLPLTWKCYLWCWHIAIMRPFSRILKEAEARLDFVIGSSRG